MNFQIKGDAEDDADFTSRHDVAAADRGNGESYFSHLRESISVQVYAVFISLLHCRQTLNTQSHQTFDKNL